MRGEADDAAYLWDMLDAAKAALSFSEGINFEQYSHGKKGTDLFSTFLGLPGPGNSARLSFSPNAAVGTDLNLSPQPSLLLGRTASQLPLLERPTAQ